MSKQIPERMCIACREMKPKKQLLRIVKNKEGEIKLDRTGKLAGRGAYICDSLACIEKCCKSRMVNKAFSQEISPEIYEAIKAEYANKKNS